MTELLYGMLFLLLLVGFIAINVRINSTLVKVLSGLLLTVVLDLFFGYLNFLFTPHLKSPDAFQLHSHIQPMALHPDYTDYDGLWGNHENHFSRSTNGTSTTENAPLLICCYGGSSTYCINLPEEQSWPSILEKKLRQRGYIVDVHNHGLPGHSFADNLKNKIHYNCNTLPYDQVLEIHYHGWNDFRLINVPNVSYDSLQNALQWHLRTTQMMTGLHDVLPNTIAYNYLYMNSIDYNSALAINFLEDYTLIFSRLLMQMHGWMHESLNVKKIHQKALHQDTEVHPSEALVMDYQKHQVKSLDHSEVEYLLIPQILNFEAIRKEKTSFAYWMPGISKQRAATYCFELDQYYRENLSDKNYVPLDKAMWTDAHFLDYGHFSATGCERFAEMICNEFVNR